jgi:hypothetical protein
MSHSEQVLDSCASHHMSLDSSSFVFVSPSLSILVMTASCALMPLTDVSYVVTPHFSLPTIYLVLLVSYVIMVII